MARALAPVIPWELRVSIVAAMILTRVSSPVTCAVGRAPGVGDYLAVMARACLAGVGFGTRATADGGAELALADKVSTLRRFERVVVVML